MELLRIAPERVAAAIFIDTKASADTDEARTNRLRVADSVIASEAVEAFTRAMLPNLIGQTSQTSRPDVVAAVNLMLSQSRPAGVAALQRAMAARPDSQAAIASFYGPVLSIRGLEDTVTSADDHAQIVSAARDGVHCDIAASGHLSPLEAPAETAAAIIEFLEQIRHGSC